MDFWPSRFLGLNLNCIYSIYCRFGSAYSPPPIAPYCPKLGQSVFSTTFFASLYSYNECQEVKPPDVNKAHSLGGFAPQTPWYQSASGLRNKKLKCFAKEKTKQGNAQPGRNVGKKVVFAFKKKKKRKKAMHHPDAMFLSIYVPICIHMYAYVCIW